MIPNPTLREHIRARAENRPGVYRMYGPGDELLYVGKSVHVRTRLLTYFRATKGEKAWELISTASHVLWEYIPNEFASLIHEMKLIQQWQPRFNVQHKRKKIYAFVKVTNEIAPRVLPVSRIAEDGATYYGPFPRVRALGESVRELSHLLGLRDCPATTPVFFNDQFEIFRDGRPPRCIRADLSTCLAPCAGRPTSGKYGAAVELAKRFLEGRAGAPLRDLQQQMAAAAARTDFEYAALLRDRLERLQSFRDELVAFRGRVQDLSFIYRVPGFRGDDRVYIIRRGRIRKTLPHPKSAKARARVADQIESTFAELDMGPAGLRSEEAAEILLIAQWFRLRPRERKRTTPPDRWFAENRPA
jgi:excinuclease ABC subunit C